MRRTIWRVGAAAACAVIVVLGLGLVAGAQTVPTVGLVWPSSSITLTKGGEALAGTVEVTNPTPFPVMVSAVRSGTGRSENRCEVSVSSGDRVAPFHSSAIAIAVAPRSPGCSTPDDGQQVVLLAATNGQPFTLPETTRIAVAKAVALPVATTPTGLVWPTGTIFLRRTSHGLAGSVTVSNPTAAAIAVTAPVFGPGCAQQATDGPSVVVPAHRSLAIPITGPTHCGSLATGDITAVASARTADGKKADSAPLTFEAEVDWLSFGWWLFGALCAGLVVAALGWLLVRRRPGLGAKLSIDSSAPPSWLTNIAAVGPAVIALATTTGLAKGLLGSDSVPETTLVLGGSAVGIALAALAALVSSLPLGTEEVEGKPQTCPRVAQFLFAAALSAAAAGIEVWAVYTALSRLDLPIYHDLLLGLAWFGAAVVGAYLFASVQHYLRHYAPAPAVVALEPADDGASELDVIVIDLSDHPEPEPEPAPVAASEELVAAVTSALAPHYLPKRDVPTKSERDEWLRASRLAADLAARRARPKGAAQQAVVASQPAAEPDPPVAPAAGSVARKLTRNLI